MGLQTVLTSHSSDLSETRCRCRLCHGGRGCRSRLWRCSWRRLLREILQLPMRLTIPGAARRNRWLRRRLGLAPLLARARYVLAQHEHVVACEPFQLAELRRSRSVAAAAGKIGYSQHRPTDGANSREFALGANTALGCDWVLGARPFRYAF